MATVHELSAVEHETAPLDLGELPEVKPGRLVVDVPVAPTRYYARPADFNDHAKNRAKDHARGMKVGVLVRVDPTGGGWLPGTWSVWSRGDRAASWLLTPWSDAAAAWAREQGVTRVDAHAWCLTPAWQTPDPAASTARR